ncbi:MAG: hypothetical protein DVB23_001271 [Verrucomicrobia bacterium]|nr:MAG: hypothetical protein DVB23_001271 [Verrucomicrobiota bacterium]
MPPSVVAEEQVEVREVLVSWVDQGKTEIGQPFPDGPWFSGDASVQVEAPESVEWAMTFEDEADIGPIEVAAG